MINILLLKDKEGIESLGLLGRGSPAAATTGPLSLFSADVFQPDADLLCATSLERLCVQQLAVVLRNCPMYLLPGGD